MSKSSLSQLLSIEELPGELGVVEQASSSLFKEIFYDNLVVNEDLRGTNIQYTLNLVTNKPLSIAIPGAGISLLLNPGITSDDASSFPLRLSIYKGFFRYLKQFKFQNFSGTAQDLFSIAKQFFPVDDASIIQSGITAFVESATPLQQFVMDVNSRMNLECPYDSNLGESANMINIINYFRNTVFINPWLVVSQTYILHGNISDYMDNLNRLFSVFIYGRPVVSNRPSPQQIILNALIPRINASLVLSPAIEFERNVLVPIKSNGQVELDERIKTRLLCPEFEFYVNSQGQFGTKENLSVTFPSQYPKAQIANTQLTIGFTNAKLDLSRTQNISEATSDGRPTDFIGVYVESATIGLPAFWQKDSSRSNAEIFGENLLIGTGGISGTVGLRALDPNSGVAPLLHTKFGPEGKGFEITLDNFDLTFRQNAIVSSDINGRLILPRKLKAVDANGKPINQELVLGVNISIDRDGFAVTAKPLGQPLTFNISDVANFTINSLQVGKEEDRFYIDASGKIKIMYDQPPLNSFLPEAIDIQRLRIWSDGQIEFRGTGGEFKLRKPISLRFPPVEMSVTAIHLGSYEGYHQGQLRKYMYFGFDGTLSLNPGGIDGKGSGIKFYFTQDNDSSQNKNRHVFMRIQTLEIDLILPEENPGLTLQGILSMRDPEPTSAFPDPGPEYIGSVTFELNKLKISGSAGMRLNPKVPAFLVDAALELSTPIVLGATGLGIYGFRGLVGMNYVASKTKIGLDANARWYDYYKKKVPPVNREGIDIGKFDLNKKGFSFGAGVSLATSADQGRAFSSKLFLLLSLPGAFLLQGQAQVVKKQRLQLTDPNDPPFSLMLAVDDRSFSVTIGVNFVMPNDSSESPGDKGSVLDAFGEFDFAFFWKDAGAWYMNLGTEERPIRAEILRLFRSYAFLMVSARGIRFGAGAGFDKTLRAGPMKIRLWAQLDVGARISFKPIQFGGFIALGGGVEIKIFGFGFGLSVQAGLAGEAPKPFIVTGRLEVCVRVLRKNRCAGIELTWEFKRDRDTTKAILINEGTGASQVAKAVNMLTGDSFPILSIPLGLNPTLPVLNNMNLDSYVIPVDSFIDIEFSKGMKSSNALGNKVGGDRGGISV